MIKVLPPFCSTEVSIEFDLGTLEWTIGESNRPLISACGMSHEDFSKKFFELALPQHLQEEAIEFAINGSLKAHLAHFEGFPLPWVWGPNWNAVKAKIEAFIGPLVIEAEKTLEIYEPFWTKKWSFVQNLYSPKISEINFSINSNLGDKYAEQAIKAFKFKKKNSWKESTTGRMYSSGGIPWGQISPELRKSGIEIKKNERIWECDIVTAEPSLVCSLLGIQENENEDAYTILGKEFGIDTSIERGILKQQVMSCLYGAGEGRLESIGVTSQGVKIINSRRREIIKIIKEKFQIKESLYFNFFGKHLKIDNEFILISHWVQSSVSDMAFEYFNTIKEATNLLPVHPIHDGCLWIEKGNGFNSWISKRNNMHEFSFESPVDSNLEHSAIIRWKS